LARAAARHNNAFAIPGEETPGVVNAAR
jgi:hypothetical protein